MESGCSVCFEQDGEWCCKEVGAVVLEKEVDRRIVYFHVREGLIHSDAHVHIILA